MAKPYALLTYLQNTNQVLLGFAVDQDLINSLSPGALITLGMTLGNLNKLITQVGEDCPQLGGTEITKTPNGEIQNGNV